MQISGVKLDAYTLFWAYRGLWIIDYWQRPDAYARRGKLAEKVQKRLEKLLKEQCNE